MPAGIQGAGKFVYSAPRFLLPWPQISIFIANRAGKMKKKEVEMICVSDLEGFDRERYESSKNKLKKNI